MSNKTDDEKVLARKFTCDTDRRKTSRQHTKPCAGCPWLRTSLEGYLGNNSPERWIQIAHGEHYIDCHNTTNQQCAGAAIYRANVCKSVKDERALTLPPDEESVFATPMEFLAHHRK
jgi:hypothetical protein